MNEIKRLTAVKTIKVAIIEDRREIREGLAMLIDGTDGFRLHRQHIGSMEEALRAHRREFAGRRFVGHRLAGNGRHRRHQDLEGKISRICSF